MKNWPIVEHAIPPKSGKGRVRGTVPGADDVSESEGSGAPRILVVEDDFFVSLEMEAALTGAGFQAVGVANSAEEAERYAAEEHPDLIVMDIRLTTERDGIDAALAIFRKLGIRSILATAHEDSHTRERAAAARPLAWLVKPYAMESLIATVRAALMELKN